MRRQVGDSVPIHAGVVHTNALEVGLALKKAVLESFNCVELDFLELGPVLGTHIGPGFFGVGFYNQAQWQPDQS